MSIEAQKQIRENTMELQEFLKDLTDWEHTVKDKEKKLVTNAAKDSRVLPVRGQSQTALGTKVNEEVDTGDGTSNKGSIKRASGAATHTYDYFKDKWDKFDVEAALQEVDEKPPKKASPKKVARSSKMKTSNTAAKIRDTAQKANVKNQSSSYSYGAPGSGSLETLNHLANPYGLDDPAPDAMSEKDLGNDHFKEGKYVQAIDCYSRSIALQPTAVAFANRAMALLRIRRYADAEVDCTEAINLDDRYTKAYSRRGTARKELQKYLAAVEDFEFALRLEPENKELKKQYNEAKEIYEKFAVKSKPMQKKVPLLVQEMKDSPDISGQSKFIAQHSEKSLKSSSAKTSKAQSNSIENGFKSSPEKLDGISLHTPAPPVSAANASIVLNRSATKPNPQELKNPVSSYASTPAISSTTGIGARISSKQFNPSAKDTEDSESVTSILPSNTKPLASPSPKISLEDSVAPTSTPSVTNVSSRKEIQKAEGPNKQVKKMDNKMAVEVIASTQAAVERAAVSARAGLARNMVAPKTSYEFETTWKGCSGDRPSQARLLKIMEASSLPKVFKDSLGAPLLMDIINCLPLLIADDARLVVEILDNLTKVGRFSMTVMFLTSKEKSGMRKLWDDVLATEQLSSDGTKHLEALHKTYRL